VADCGGENESSLVQFDAEIGVSCLFLERIVG